MCLAAKRSPFFAIKFAPQFLPLIPEEKRAEIMKIPARVKNDLALEHTDQFLPLIPKEQRAEVIEIPLSRCTQVGFELADRFLPYLTEAERCNFIETMAKARPDNAISYMLSYWEYLPEEKRQAVPAARPRLRVRCRNCQHCHQFRHCRLFAIQAASMARY